jgi:hypothetical protein
VVTKRKTSVKPKKVAVKLRIKTYVSVDKQQCLTHLKRIYEERGNQTARHYYYQMLGCHAIGLIEHKNSAKNAYAFVCRLLVEARKKGIIPWSAVIDPGRRRTSYSNYDLKYYAKLKMGSAIMLDFWRGQPRRVEIWVEKEAIFELVQNTVYRYRIPVNINKGYGSATVIHDAAERYGKGKGWTLLYIGDFDPSGLDIDRCLRDSLKEHGSRPNIVRIALTQEDTVSLIPMAGLSLKKTDSRYQRFVELYGSDQKGYEIDSLPADILRKRIIEALNTHMDLDLFKKVIELEDAVDERLAAELEGTLNDVVDELLEGVSDSTLPRSEQHRYLLAKDEYNEANYEDEDEDEEDEDSDEDEEEDDYEE